MDWLTPARRKSRCEPRAARVHAAMRQPGALNYTFRRPVWDHRRYACFNLRQTCVRGFTSYGHKFAHQQFRGVLREPLAIRLPRVERSHPTTAPSEDRLQLALARAGIGGPGGADQVLAQSPTANWQEVQSSLENVASSAGESIMPVIAPGLNSLSGGINGLATSLQSMDSGTVAKLAATGLGIAGILKLLGPVLLRRRWPMLPQYRRPACLGSQTRRPARPPRAPPVHRGCRRSSRR